MPETPYTHDTLRALFARSVKQKFTLGMLEIALELCADAWEAREKDLMDIGRQAIVDCHALEAEVAELRGALESAAQTLSNLAHGDIIGDAKQIALNAAMHARRAALPPAGPALTR